MKKLLFVIESLHHGGAEKSLITLLNTVDLNHFAVDLMLFKKGGEFENFLPKNINVIYQTATKFSFYSRLIYWINKRLYKKHHTAQLFWKSFNTQITSNNTAYDIAIAYNQGFATYYVASKINAKIKYSWLNTDYLKAKYNANFDNPYYNNYTKIIAVSNEAHNSLISAHKNLKPQILIIKDLIDKPTIEKKALEQKNVLTKTENNLNILTVGRLAKAKGYHLAIKACKLLIERNYAINWYVIGDGNQREELKKLISNTKIQDNFHLLGFKENPYPYINQCNIYVQPSLFEGLGLSVIEASILNKPIICTNFPTASSVIKHNETGLICDMTAEAIAKSIEQYIKNPEMVKKVTENLKKVTNNDKEVSLRKINDLLS